MNGMPRWRGHERLALLVSLQALDKEQCLGQIHMSRRQQSSVAQDSIRLDAVHAMAG